MDTTGLTSGVNKCVDLFQWAGSAISSDMKEQRFQNNLFDLQRDLQCLSDTLPAMYSLINRAEWTSHNVDVVRQLPNIKDAVYDVEDILDELRWYNHKVIVESNASQLSFTDFYNSFNKVNIIRERLKTNSELIEKMGLVEVTFRFDKTSRPETSSFPNETKIFGRDMALKKVMRLLGVPTRSSNCSKRKREINADNASASILPSDQINESRLQDLPVLPIFGMGGVGKTTLAQHISSHPKVKSHFDTIIWICVSNDFDEKRLTKEAIESITEMRQFLIVLDDMWDDALNGTGACWKRFCSALKNVLRGSIMMVTTRSKRVANFVQTMEPIRLEGLDKGVFWNFFKLCAFGSESSHDPDLELIGRKIVSKLKGSPLAAKTLGRMSRSDLSTSHWNNILDSELWELEQDSTEIVPALRLSYMYLPFHLKRCFSFCAVYPKDKEFEKGSLAEIWAAEGFVKRLGVIPVQDIGCQYFNELLNRSFFQKVQASDEQGLGCRFIKNMKQLRGHLEIRNVDKLRKDHLAEAELKNKGYLDKLTLEWSACASQSGDNENGIEVLRHPGVKSLVLEEYPGVSLPSWFQPESLSGLTSASFSWCRELEIPTVPIDINSSSMGFSSLTDLILQRCSSLSSLEQLLDPAYLPVIKKIAIMHCRNLISVPTEKFEEFRCIEIFKVGGCGKINSQSLVARSLKKLQLGTQDMYWSNDCGNLSAANIQCCSLTCFSLSCKRLTSIQLQMWNLPALQELRISYCHSLTSIGQPGQVFTNLTSLSLSDCEELSTIDGLLEEEYQHAIKSITINNCDELSTMTLHRRRFGGFSSLENLNVSRCHDINWGGFVLPSSLQSHLWSSTLSSLEELEIWDCPELVSVGGADDISEIPNVLIEACKKLRGIKQPVRRGSFLKSKK
ncbi:hypothetical protein CFC21_054122 [Triticum aestivum]|uniref:NB-ARC domain-containing protein n=2 Tax=Triticum aestivum TaxID=4565 RepID=A0A9R1K8N0_WHEAT|nr:hypothetical protein CFC21_054122 [Triticum aestivum]